MIDQVRGWTLPFYKILEKFFEVLSLKSLLEGVTTAFATFVRNLRYFYETFILVHYLLKPNKVVLIEGLSKKLFVFEEKVTGLPMCR